MGQRLRQAHEVAVALEAGESAAQVRKRLRMPSKAADQLLNDARRAGVDRLRAAIEQMADLELASRGGGGKGGAGEDTVALLAIQKDRGPDHPRQRVTTVRRGGRARRVTLLAGAGVPVQRAGLDRLVDRLYEREVLGVGGFRPRRRRPPPRDDGSTS